ncbi:MAG: hypothetical protein K8S18_10350, partial [Desulfobacula sp.]|nr:hypothetical protein [Desulfobacula sp.]
MKKIILYLFVLLIIISCEKVLMEKIPADNPVENFNSLWNTANEKYAYFEYKNINWNEVYDQYRPQIHNGLNNYELFDLLGSMLNELKDGHVNLTAPFDISRYNIDFFAPENFDFRLIKDHYTVWDYRITGCLIHTIYQRKNDDIGYIYY